MPTLNYLLPALDRIHPEWNTVLQQPEISASLSLIDKALTHRTQAGFTIYPPRERIFSALEFCSPAQIKVVILGQDPYHGAGEAMGLSFSVPPSVRIPPSLRNIFKEQAQDLGLPIPRHGDLSHWARQGVLLLNSTLTVDADAAGSHGKIGWQAISDSLIDCVSHNSPGCVFLLWGNWARTKAERIDAARHLVLTAAHPSPLSASRGFMGCRHFSQANQWLTAHGQQPIDWSLPEAQTMLF